MTLRITTSSASYASLSNLQNAQSNLAKLQNQLSSGNAITTPSDDPAGTVTALQLRGEQARNNQFATNASDALSYLSSQDSAYGSMTSLLQQARTLTLQAMNTGTADSTSTSSISQQLDAIKTQMISLANTSYNGRSLFGGTTSGQAYDASGNYTGTDSTITRQVGANTSVSVSSVGTDVFGSGSSSVFSVLSDLSTAVAGGTVDSSSLDGLDASLTQLTAARATEGTTYNQVQQAQATQQATATTLTTQLSGIENIDIADMAVKVTTASTTYQAALQTTASIRQLSLLNFLN